MSIGMPGGWTSWNFTLSHEAMQVFKEATRGLLGVSYTPLAFASQVVAGLNYSFLCKATAVVPDPPTRVVKMHLFQPLPGGGTPQITQIIDITP